MSSFGEVKSKIETSIIVTIVIEIPKGAVLMPKMIAPIINTTPKYPCQPLLFNQLINRFTCALLICSVN
ncbi:MAG: hypothetical protein A2Z28_06535 [Chloroflexi bacterium RBG_16_51_9]|nr:MAG: hypothetical protein A2Z28_06535 [Chloroflexi bacterium RBG_16_51_9]